ncbi:signal peptidase I [Thermoflavimicrobium daqui]|jgi:signal peptidase I|uniref:Signal peptidase I n=2 Tax=Thermoflavimicrobium daqui TaxID=2137476 RepID=A0A364K7C3_9BACL|nr:signal peptidase I [Thermoflavimicrobium daqui]
MNQTAVKNSKVVLHGFLDYLEWIWYTGIAIILALLVRTFLFQPVPLSGPSMLPTFHQGDWVVINKWVYTFRPPKRGEVVIFYGPNQRIYIKRVVAVGGDTIEADQGNVYVNRHRINESYLTSTYTSYFFKRKVPWGKLFVMGDNRLNSMDSRDFGPISVNQVIGRADLVIWPVRDIKWIN